MEGLLLIFIMWILFVAYNYHKKLEYIDHLEKQPGTKVKNHFAGLAKWRKPFKFIQILFGKD